MKRTANAPKSSEPKDVPGLVAPDSASAESDRSVESRRRRIRKAPVPVEKKGKSRAAKAILNQRPNDRHVNRSEFVQKVLKLKPKATLQFVRDRWKSVGGKTRLSSVLFYQVKKKLGIKRQANVGMAVTHSRNMPNSSSNVFLEIESKLDSMILMVAHDESVCDRLRAARRQVSAKLFSIASRDE